MPDLQARPVTLLFTDIEGSTRLLRRLGDRRYAEVLAQHQQLLRNVFVHGGGREIETQGDGFFFAFPSATDAVATAVRVQQTLATHPWPDGVSLRVRIGLHTGVPVDTEGRYVGVGVHRAARICQISHGGQVLLSQTTADMVEGDLPEGVSLRNLREHRLKDIAHPERIFQLVIPGLPAEFPRLKSMSKRPTRIQWAVVAITATVAAVGIGREYQARRISRIDSVAVLPLQNLSGDPSQEYLADGLTEALISTLGQVRSLRVISRTSVMRFKGTRQPLPEIAKRLGVDAVVEGSVVRSGRRVRVTAKLIHAVSDRHLWSRHYDRDFRDVISLQNEVARAVVSEIQQELTAGEQARMTRPRPVDPEAHEAYLRGLYEFNKPRARENLLASIAQFERAVERDPQHALAWAGLSSAYSRLAIWSHDASQLEHVRRAKATALTAVKIDPTVAEAHDALGFAYVGLKEWALAEKSYRKALELNPNSARVASSYTYLLFTLGRIAEAVEQARRNRELDPLGSTTSAQYANMLFFARRYDEAVAEIRKVLEIEPRFGFAYSILGRALIEQGKHREGVAAVWKAEELGMSSPYHLGMIGRAHVLMRDKAEALKMLAQANEAGKRIPAADTAQAIIYAALGDTTEAMAALERGHKRGDVDAAATARNSPWFDSLRSDPRYKAFERGAYGNYQ